MDPNTIDKNKPEEQPEQPTRNLTIDEQKAQRKADKAALLKKMQEERRASLRPSTEVNPEEEEEKPEEKPEEEKPEEKPKDENPEEEEEKPEEKPEEEEDDDDGFDDFDLDDDDDDEVEKKPTQDDDDEEEEEVSGIRQRLKQEGQARKQAETDLIEAQGEVEKLETRIKELESKHTDLQASQVNWNTHESIAPLWDKFDAKIQRGAISLPDESTAAQFLKDQDPLVAEYFKLSEGAKTPQEKVAADIKFKRELSERYQSEDGTLANGDTLVDVIKDSLDIYLKIEDTKDELMEKFKEGSLSQGIDSYDMEVSKYREVLDDLGNIDDDIIEADPKSPHGVVGARIKEDPEFAKVAKKEAAAIKQFIFGLRPLTQDEMDTARRRAATRNMPLEDYLKFRESNFQKKRAEFINRVHTHSLAMKDYAEMRDVYEKVMEKKNARKRSKDALRKAKAPKEEPPKKEAPKKASERPYIPPSQRFR